jgi:hypothetical protein
MKKLVLILVCAMSALFATAQTKITWNVEVGIGTSMWMGSGSNESNAIFSPRVGVGIDIPLTSLVSFKTGLHWVSKGAEKDIAALVGEDYSLPTVIQSDQNYLQFPLLASFHLGTPKNFDVVLSGGLYFAYGISGEQEYDMNGVSMSWSTFKDKPDMRLPTGGLRRFDAGVQIGGALDFKHWTVGLNGEFGLCKIVENGPRNLGFYATVGYKF